VCALWIGAGLFGTRRLERAARLAVENPYYNPAPIRYESILALLRAAWHGERPAVARKEVA